MKKVFNFKIFSSILITIFIILLISNKIDLNILTGENRVTNNFNIITISSIFSGFLFTSLSLLLGFSSNKFLINLEHSGYMKDIYHYIIVGLITSFITIILAIGMIFLKDIEKNIKIIFDFIIPSAELFTLGITILFFCKAIYDVTFVIRQIRKRIELSIDNKDIKSTTDLINKKKL